MREVTCIYCKHIQKTRSKLDRITCSSCGKKIPNENTIPHNNIEPKKISEDNNLQTNINTEELKRVKLD